MAISANHQCVALGCRFLDDKSAYIFFYDLTQGMRRVGRAIHEGAPGDSDEKSFISLAFSPDTGRVAALTNIKLGNVKIYEWRKESRVIAASCWLDELKKSSKPDEFAEVKKVSVDPNDKDQICMTGKNHVRIWRNNSGILKPMQPIIKLDTHRTFTDHIWLDNSWLVCGTDKGELCFIHEAKQCMFEASAFGVSVEPVSCLISYPKGVIVAGETGLLALWAKTELDRPDDSKPIMSYVKTVSKEIRASNSVGDRDRQQREDSGNGAEHEERGGDASPGLQD